MSLPFDVTIFKRCPKSRQVHARINPLDLMLPEVILREGPKANKDTGKDQARKLEKRVAEPYVKK